MTHEDQIRMYDDVIARAKAQRRAALVMIVVYAAAAVATLAVTAARWAGVL